MMRRRHIVALAAAVVTVVVITMTAGAAWAGWSAGSITGGRGAAKATAVGPGAKPTATSNAGSVTVSWSATVLTTGDPVGGYVITRYDASTFTEQTVTTGCAGLITATTCTETEMADGRWVYTVTPVIGAHWAGDESAPSDPVVTDSTAPTNAITITVLAGHAFQSGATVFYGGVAAGSFALSNAVADSGSGPASSTSAALTGDATGWTQAPSTVSLPSGGPYVSQPFSWSAATTGSPDEAVTGHDGAGNSRVTTLSFVDDSTPPTAGTVSYLNGYQPDQSVTVTFTTGTDAGSGVATRQLQRADAVLTGGLCGTFSSFADIGADGPSSPYVDTRVSNGSCYVYRYVVTDQVGNQNVTTGTSVAKVDPSDGGPALGAARTYSVLAGSAVVNTLATTISGDLGVSPGGSVTGFPPGTIAGSIHTGDAAAAAARSALMAAYDDAAARAPDATFAGDQNGNTFTPGVYRTTAAFGLTGTMTLDAQGDPQAIFIFQIGAALTTAAASTIALVNGAKASNVYWQVAGAASTGAGASFAGTIMATGAITLGDGTLLIGSALSYTAVTLADDTIRFTTALPPVLSIDGGGAVQTKDTTPTITGTTNAATGSTVSATVAGQTLTTDVQSDGTWSVTAAALLAGAYTVTASVRDRAGNAGTGSQTLTIEINPTAVALNTSATYSVLAGTAVVGTGTTTMTGDLGVSPSNSVTGFPPGTVGGTIHRGDPVAAQAQADLVSAYGDAAGRAPSGEFSGDQNGQTFDEGVHHSANAFALTGTLTLDAQGDPNAVFIIQVGAALNTAASSTVALVNGAQASHVYWQVAGAVTTGATSAIVGTIMANGAITLGAGTQLAGRALSGSTITLADDTIVTA